jgi:hypothetical protein
MIVGLVLKPMEKLDMSLSQCKQIRERFLVKSRAHLLACEVIDPRGANVDNALLSRSGEQTPSLGTTRN